MVISIIASGFFGFEETVGISSKTTYSVNIQIIIVMVLSAIFNIIIPYSFVNSHFQIGTKEIAIFKNLEITWVRICLCLELGLISSCILIYFMQRVTSHNYNLTKNIYK